MLFRNFPKDLEDSLMKSGSGSKELFERKSHFFFDWMEFHMLTWNNRRGKNK